MVIKRRLYWFRVIFYCVYTVAKGTILVIKIIKLFEKLNILTTSIIDLVMKNAQVLIMLPIDIILFILTVHFIRLKIRH